MAPEHHISSQHSVPSPDGALIATLQQNRLVFSACDGVFSQSIPLNPDVVLRCRLLRWSRPGDHSNEILQGRENGKGVWLCSRILLAGDDTIRVYDVNDPKWCARIERASGNLGRIADVAFGHTANEVLVFSDFGVKLTIWSLITRRGVEIRDPKYSVHCYTYRARTGHMAILTRPHAQDILMLFSPEEYGLLKIVELPTVDAQEISWSRDGQWLAVRDTASSGHKLFIYTADGHLFKTYSSEENITGIGLGISHLEWSPSNGQLAFGDYNDKVTILGNNSFSPIANFLHPNVISLSDVSIWQEQLDALKMRSYTAAPQPASPPTSILSTKATTRARGFSVISFNSDGSLLVSKNDAIPTTVWIWSLHTGSPIAVLIHHSPVKHLAWHPMQPDLLLIQCAIPEAAIHLWKSTWEVPQIVTLPLERKTGRLEASWLLSPTASQFNLIVSSANQYSTALLSPSGEMMPRSPSLLEGAKSFGADAEDMFDEGNSLDLSPIKITHDETLEVRDGIENGVNDSGSSFGLGNEMVDDTFHYRRHIKATS